MLEARVDRLEAVLQRLAEAQAQTQAELRALAEAQRRTEQRLGELAARVDALAGRVEALAEAQLRTEQRLEELTARVVALTDRVDALAARVEALAGRVEALAEAQLRTEQRLEELAARVDALTARVDALAARVDALAARVDALAEAQLRTEQRLEELAAQVSRLTGVVGNLMEKVLEGDYREKAHSYFLRILLGIRSVPRDEIAALAADAERRALLSIDEHADLMQVDVVVRGRLRDRDVDGYLVAEVSSVVDARDVQRAARRARLLERIAGAQVVAAVAGERISPEADLEASAAGVWRVLNGRAFPPGSPAAPGLERED